LAYNIILNFYTITNNTSKDPIFVYYVDTRDNDPFADWSRLVNMPVYSIDRKKLGYLRAIYSDCMIIVRGVIKLIKYFIPKSAAESVTKNSIKLRITAYEANSNYSYLKIENYLKLSEYSPGSTIGHKPFYDRLLNLGYYATRNRLAAGVAFISIILFYFCFQAIRQTWKFIV
jgi:hypothetical protein